MQPRVSFVVPCYNYGRYVARAINSLLEQTFQSLEVIVIDDCSPDNTAEVVASYADDPRVRLIRHAHNRGHIASYNEGIELARGDFVGIMSADDFAMQCDAVERQVAVFEADSRVGFVYSGHGLADASDTVFSTYLPFESDYVRPGLDEFARLISQNYIPASGTLVRRSCHVELGVYDPALPHAGDWELWLRLATRHAVGYVAAPLYAYRTHESNMSHAGVPPRRANAEMALTLEKAFSALPADAPANLRRQHASAFRQALLNSIALERKLGRMKRSWEGVADGVRRSPSLVTMRAFHLTVVRLLILSLLGQQRYRRLAVLRYG